MPGKLGEHQRPYRPRDPRVLTPYDMPAARFRHDLSAPVIGLDGGILIPHTVVSRESKNGTLLGEFLAHRTMQTGTRFAVTHDDEGKLEFHSAAPGTWDTSRRMGKYYGVNYGSGPDDKFVRNERLRANLERDANMISRWPEVEASIKQYDPETQWRLYTAIFQNFSHDWIGLDYAYRVASHYDPELARDSDHISQAVFDGVTQYYKLLANPTLVTSESITIPDPGHYLTSAAILLDKMRRRDNSPADTIRNRSETDHSFQTLAAAQTFITEFSAHKTPPAVVIPLLGAYHLGPALAALGYQGEIIPIVAGHKIMKGDTRKDSDLPLPMGLAERLAGREFVIFEDTFLTGGTLTYLTNEFRRAGLEPMALRTMFMGKTPPDSAKFPPDLQAKFLAYYDTPSGRNVHRGDSMGATVQKATTRAWARASEQVGE